MGEDDLEAHRGEPAKAAGVELRVDEEATVATTAMAITAVDERVRLALVDANLLDEHDDLPPYDKVSPSLGGKSEVRHYRLTDRATGKPVLVVVKVTDDPRTERATLRALPPEIQDDDQFLCKVKVEEPRDPNTPLVFQDAKDLAATHKSRDLSQLLSKSWPQPFHALDSALRVLRKLHDTCKPARESGKPWTAAFEDLVPDHRIKTAKELVTASLGDEWSSKDEVCLGCLACGLDDRHRRSLGTVRNPLESKAGSDVPEHRRGWVHGDANLTNILFTLRNDNSIDRAILIDFARARIAATAWDYAQLEAEICMHVLSAKHRISKLTVASAIAAFTSIRSILDGTRRIPLSWYLIRGIHKWRALDWLLWTRKWRALELLLLLRQQAAEDLERDITHYAFADFFSGLRHYFFGALAFEKQVFSDPHKRALALVGAALTAKVLGDLPSYKPAERIRKLVAWQKRQTWLIPPVLLLLFAVVGWDVRKAGRPRPVISLAQGEVTERTQVSIGGAATRTAKRFHISAFDCRERPAEPVRGMGEGRTFTTTVEVDPSDESICARFEPSWDATGVAVDCGRDTLTARLTLPPRDGGFAVKIEVYRDTWFQGRLFAASGIIHSVCRIEVQK